MISFVMFFAVALSPTAVGALGALQEEVLLRDENLAMYFSKDAGLKIALAEERANSRLCAISVGDVGVVGGPTLIVTTDARHVLEVQRIVERTVKDLGMITSYDSQGRAQTQVSHGPVEEKGHHDYVVIDGNKVRDAEEAAFFTWCAGSAKPAFVLRDGQEHQAVIGDNVLDRGGPLVELSASRDGTRYAYARRSGDTWEVVLTGASLGKFEKIRHVRLSASGEHVAYAAKQRAGEAVMWDRTPVAEADEVAEIEATGETLESLIWLAKRPDGWYIESTAHRYGPVDEVVGPFGKVLQVAPGGNWAAVVVKSKQKLIVSNGHVLCEVPSDAGVDLFGGFASYCPGIKTFAYQEHRDDGWYVVAGARTWGPFPRWLEGMAVSADGSAMAGCTLQKVYVGRVELSGKWRYVFPHTLQFASGSTLRFAGLKQDPSPSICSWSGAVGEQ